jgi:transcriptional regulator with XRE-family HTH domain
MGFRENLKSELVYSGMLIKELAEKSGVNKHTINKYLREECCSPSADSALRIAGVFGISVEYLMTGHDVQHSKVLVNPDIRFASEILSELNDEDRKLAIALIQVLKENRKK